MEDSPSMVENSRGHVEEKLLSWRGTAVSSSRLSDVMRQRRWESDDCPGCSLDPR